MSSLSRQQLVSFLNEVDISNDVVLDCGCGPERYHARNWVHGEPADYHTLDVNPDYNPTYNVNLNTGVQTDRMPCVRAYDTVFLLETAEHLWRPLRAISLIKGWLKFGGGFYFSAPFINPIHDQVDYLRLTDEWWRKAAMEVGLDIDFIKPRVASDGWPILKQFYVIEGLRMSKCRLRNGESHKKPWIGFFGKMTKH